jgi:hypothetical protein
VTFPELAIWIAPPLAVTAQPKDEEHRELLLLPIKEQLKIVASPFSRYKAPPT